jgi:hypothetical protein
MSAEPAPRKPAKIGDENASSYMLFTVVTLVIAVPTVVVNHFTSAGRAWLAIASILLYVANLLGILELFWREWFAPRPIVRLPPETVIFGHEIPWRLVRLLDHYIAFSVAFSLVLLSLWAFDPTDAKTKYFVFASGIHATNTWAVWNSFVVFSFSILAVDGGFGEMVLNNELSVALCGWQIFLSLPINVAVVALVITRGIEANAARREQIKRAQQLAGGQERSSLFDIRLFGSAD